MYHIPEPYYSLYLEGVDRAMSQLDLERGPDRDIMGSRPIAAATLKNYKTSIRHTCGE